MEAATCGHCGLPVRGSRPGIPAWCCSGCALVDGLTLGGGDGRSGSDPLLARVALSGFLSMGIMVASLSLYGQGWVPEPVQAEEGPAALRGLSRAAALLLSLPVLQLIGAPLALAIVRTGRWLSVDGLVLLGVGGAFAASVWNTVQGGGEVYFEGAAMVLTLVGLGRWMDVRTKERARQHVVALAEEEWPAAHRVGPDGAVDLIEVEDLRVGDRLRVGPGSVVPVDGVIEEGRAWLDTARLTGEEEPRSAGPGDRVLAGSTVVDATVLVRAEAVGAGRVREQVEQALTEALERAVRPTGLADRLARWLLPLAAAVALGAGLYHGLHGGPERGLMVALSVLVVACPCALGLATPLAWWTALAEAWRRGILVRGGDVLEALAQVETVFLDKTGTLTEPVPTLTRVEVHEDGLAEASALSLARALEAVSDHPVARALRREVQTPVGDSQHHEAPEQRESSPGGGSVPCQPAVTEARALPGLGVEGTIDGRRLFLGRPLAVPESDAGQELVDRAPTLGTVVELREGSAVLATLQFEARPTAAAREAVDGLRRLGLEPVVLTGDGPVPARLLARSLGLSVESGLLPDAKAARIEGSPGRTLFIGDGLNDAAALAVAEVGIAVAGATPRSMALADATLVGASVAEVPGLLELARWSVAQARRNLAWTVAYNAVALAAAAAGLLHPALAALLMALSSATVVGLTRLARGMAEARPVGTSQARVPSAPAVA